MRLLYLAPSDIQLPRVDRQCIVAFCSALREGGVDVELVAIRIRTLESEPRGPNPLALYRIRTPFPVRLIRVPVRQTSSESVIAASRWLAHAYAIARAAPGRGGPVTLFSKTWSTLRLSLVARRLRPASLRVAFEAHLPPSTRAQRRALRHADRVIANTHALARDLVEEGGLDAERVLGIHQGVDLRLAEERRTTREEARQRLGLPRDRRLIVYTGKIHRGYREVELLLEAARQMEADEGVEFVLVGGRADHVAHFRKRVASEARHNVRFEGFVAPSVVPDYQFAADVLVMYYQSGMELNEYRSPGKLFEYMASGRPIAAVDLPVLREVLGEDPAAEMVPVDAPEELAEAIRRLLSDPARAAALAERALERVAEFTWEERARRITAFLED